MSTRPTRLLGQLSSELTIPANTSRAGIKVVGLGVRLLITIRVTGPCMVRVLAKEIGVPGRNVVYRGEVVQDGATAVFSTYVQNKEDVAIDIATGASPAVFNSLSLLELAPRA